MFDFLAQFDKRMAFIAAADSLINRQNTAKEFEQTFGRNTIDNLLVSVLVFIMERTLSEEHDCTLASIAGFLRAILPAYGQTVSDAQAGELARYLIKDILQNKGTRRTYRVMRYPDGPAEQDVRLIADRDVGHGQVVYELTRQGYDFLFRTKEVDDKLGFQIEEIRLQLQIEKHYYHDAIGQSRNLLRLLRQKQNELDQFDRQMRQDLSSISGEVYEDLIRGIDAMLTEEYRMLEKIEDQVRRAQAHFEEERDRRGRLDEKALQAKTEVDGIFANVRRALERQRSLIAQCASLQNRYVEILQNAILYHTADRYDMEAEVLKPLAAKTFHSPEEADSLFQKLLAPLLLPRLPAVLNLKMIYDRQARISESGDEQPRETEEIESEKAALERIEQRNAAHVRLIDRLFAFAASHPQGFSLRDFCGGLEEKNELEPLCRERLLFLAMLKLYEIGQIDLSLWAQRHEEWVEDGSGEFDLAYCLGRIAARRPDLYGLRSLSVRKGCGTAVFSLSSGRKDEAGPLRIQMENLLFEVKRNEGNLSDPENTLDER